MKIFVFSKNTALKPVFPKTADFFNMEMLSAHSPENDNLTYLNILNLPDDELKKALVLLKKNCKDKPWGIIDPKDNMKDIADLFLKGACDYLGSAVLKLQASLI